MYQNRPSGKLYQKLNNFPRIVESNKISKVTKVKFKIISGGTTWKKYMHMQEFLHRHRD